MNLLGKRIFALAMTLVMLLSMSTGTELFAYAAGRPGSAQSDEPQLSGSGTEEDPYLIYTLAELEMFRDSVNAKESTFQSAYVKLMSDIVMNEPEMFEYDELGYVSGLAAGQTPYQWTPIQVDGNYWGWMEFDGNGHRIKGLYVASGTNRALFGYLGDNSVIKNLGVTDGYVLSSTSSAAGIADHLMGTIQNSYNSCTIVGRSCVGGITATLSRDSGSTALIEDCYNFGRVTGTESTIGGIVGSIAGSDINTRVKDCYNLGPVTGGSHVGGIAGRDGYIESCYNAGTVFGTTGVGGILGYTMNGVATNCYNTGDVYGNDEVGGLVGKGNVRYNSGTYRFSLYSSYNIGQIYCNGANSGGIAGSITSSSSAFYSWVAFVFEDCFFLDSTAAQAIGSINGTRGEKRINRVLPKTAEEMADTESYTGFDFESVWMMGVDIFGYPYPMLTALYDSYVPISTCQFALSVRDENNNILPNGFTVKWYEKGTNILVGTGLLLYGADEEKEFEYEILLGEELSCGYRQPERREAVCEGDSNEIVVTLEPIGTLTVSGRVVDQEGEAIRGAAVVLRQTFNGQYIREIPAALNEDGTFSAMIRNVPTVVELSAEGYYTREKTVIMEACEESDIALGNLTMTRLPENKITLELNKTAAAYPGEEGLRSPLFSTNGLSFTLYNQTQDKAITDFLVQYPYLILADGEAAGNDTLLVNAADAGGQMTAVPASVTLDAQMMGVCVIEFVENGRFALGALSGCETGTVMLFDGSGQWVRSASVGSNYLSEPLPAGTYTAVFLKKTELLRSVSCLERLADFGLSEGADYLVKSVTITNGRITDLGAVNIPELDESRLYYTVPEQTGFSASLYSAMVGRYIVMRCAYEIDERYPAEQEAVMIELPEGVAVAGGSVTLDGTTHTYSLVGNTLTVATNRRAGVIRFYTVAVNTGRKDFNASLSFQNGQSGVLQPIGTASFTAEAGKLTVPEKTGQTTVTVSGTTMARSKVTVYDNDTEVGTTLSNANGNWSLRFELVDPSDFSYHGIYITVENDALDFVIRSKESILIYDRDLVEVSKLTMINTAHPENSSVLREYQTVFNFLNPSAVVPYYRYWPKYPLFTFEVAFTDGDGDDISDVYVVTENTYGEQDYIPCTYDSVTGKWLGTHEYGNADDLPVSVSVSYQNTHSAALSLALEHLSGFRVTDHRIEENVYCFNMETGGLKYSVKNYPLSESPVLIPDGIPGYERIEESPESEFTVYYCEENENLIAINGERLIVMECIEKTVNEQNTGNISAGGLRTVRRASTREELGLNGVPAREIARRVSKMLDDLENGRCGANGDIYTPEYARSIRNNLRARRVYGTASMGFAFWNLFNTATDDHVTEDDLSDMVDAFDDVGAQANATFRYLLQTYGHLVLDLNCEPDVGQDPPQGVFSSTVPAPVSPIQDPSGCVYEAVPSNRLEGVRAEAYVYDYEYDEFGMPSETKTEIFWNAEDYDQVNPLYTDLNGEYAWDVPVGQWLVKFSKEGYYDADSRGLPEADDEGYLPVPPPQTEVNVGMVSKAAPTLESVSSFRDAVRIVFSQYMQIDTVNPGTVTVTAGGAPVSGTLTPVNAEYDYEQLHQYASVFLFTPAAELSGTVSVTASGAVNYAGTPMLSPATQSDAAAIRPEALIAADELAVTYNSGALLELTVEPAGAGQNAELEVISWSPSIAGIANVNVTTDANGHANIMVLGKLPGQAEITITLKGTELQKTVRVTVSGVENAENRCEKVTANLVTGSTVDYGTLLELSTGTEGAEIYYTLDGTCPCATDSPSRIKYTGPIRLTKDCFLIAYAVKDGLSDSYTAGFMYFVSEFQNPFSDVPARSWYEKAVLWAVQNGITSGTGGGKFSPKKTCTREQVMTFLYAAAGKPEHHQEINPFTDVKKKYYYNPVMWAVENKITSGTSATTFGVGKPCTREQVVTFLWKAAGSPEPTSTECRFTDVNPKKYYYKAILWALENKITGGMSAAKFGVGKTCTRAQIVTFLYKAYGKETD